MIKVILEFSNILTIMLMILIIFSVIIYLIYRLYPKVKYNKESYDEPISDDPPALINSFFGGKIVGEINIESFYITILDLINRKYISVKIVSKNQKIAKKTKRKIFQNKTVLEDEKVLDKIILKINKSSIDKLHPFEKNVLRCLATLKYKGDIDILNTKDVIYKRLKVNVFQKNYDAWMKNFHDELLKDNKLSFFKNEGKDTKFKWGLFKKYYNKNLKSSNKSQEFLDKGIIYLPYLVAMGISKSLLLDSFSESTNVTEVYLFLKYGEYSLVKNIVQDFLDADGSFDPKYYNTSGNFVPGYG